MLVDTDVLIWNLRGNARAADRLDAMQGFLLSAATYMELVQGVRDKSELRALRQALSFWSASRGPLGSGLSFAHSPLPWPSALPLVLPFRLSIRDNQGCSCPGRGSWRGHCGSSLPEGCTT